MLNAPRAVPVLCPRSGAELHGERPLRGERGLFVASSVPCLLSVEGFVHRVSFSLRHGRSIASALGGRGAANRAVSVQFRCSFGVSVVERRANEGGQLVKAELPIVFAPFWLDPLNEFAVQGSILRGWTLAEQGQMEAGISRMRQGLAAFQVMGIESTRPYNLALLAEVYGKAGRREEGLTTLAEALAIVDKTGERMYEAELYRLKGELTLAQSSVQGLMSSVQTNQKAKSKRQKSKITNPQSLISNPQAESKAEACFHTAIDIARQQQAKSLELRVAMSLARLWLQQGKKIEARQLLAEVYHWFTEGFETKDLQEAKALLDELR